MTNNTFKVGDEVLAKGTGKTFTVLCSHTEFLWVINDHPTPLSVLKSGFVLKPKEVYSVGEYLYRSKRKASASSAHTGKPIITYVQKEESV